VQLLLGRDDIKTDISDGSSWTALTFAARREHKAIVRLLLGKDNVDPNLKNWFVFDIKPSKNNALTGGEGKTRTLKKKKSIPPTMKHAQNPQNGSVRS